MQTQIPVRLTPRILASFQVAGRWLKVCAIFATVDEADLCQSCWRQGIEHRAWQAEGSATPRVEAPGPRV